MIFQFRVISKSEYKDINLSRWSQTVSRRQQVNPTASLEQRAIEENREFKRQQTLTNENQQYLKKRLRTDFSV